MLPGRVRRRPPPGGRVQREVLLAKVVLAAAGLHVDRGDGHVAGPGEGWAAEGHRPGALGACNTDAKFKMHFDPDEKLKCESMK